MSGKTGTARTDRSETGQETGWIVKNWAGMEQLCCVACAFDTLDGEHAMAAHLATTTHMPSPATVQVFNSSDLVVA